MAKWLGGAAGLLACWGGVVEFLVQVLLTLNPESRSSVEVGAAGELASPTPAPSPQVEPLRLPHFQV